ncbi:uncharacterized protein LOC126551662 isoform X1 [Aphis gossypii]|uniref:uncharacterized protein LOC126551662 isoform X1 n=2 Tax=Aphis gossypii TaxID=80765 RepID=UPI002159A753|nr:uncharacterized protein LOC126551662 isoform X1 [Aphis gossypii]
MLDVIVKNKQRSAATLIMKKERKKHKDKNKKPPSDSCTPGCSSMDCMGLQQIPSSPPPSYEHSLQEPGQSSDHGGHLQQMVADDDICAEGSGQQPCNSEIECHSNGSPVRQEIFHKSSKEFYKAVAAQFGITCKMSDHCRCLECQSRYFDCEYDQENEQEKTDGGLGAGTPMFLSEVMHGSTCTLI